MVFAHTKLNALQERTNVIEKIVLHLLDIIFFFDFISSSNKDFYEILHLRNYSLQRMSKNIWFV